jgi:simple sugar transport system substrate-binding protein
MKPNRPDSPEPEPFLEVGGDARDKLPGGLVSNINAAVEEKNWWAKHPQSRRRFLLNGVLLGATAAGSSVLAACSQGVTSNAGTTGPGRSSIVVGYPQADGTVAFFQAIANGAKQAGADLGVTVNYKSSSVVDFSAEQARLFSAVAISKPTGMITGIWDASAMEAPITSAIKQGILVMNINASPDVENPPFGVLSFVGQSEFIGGQKAGALFRQSGVKQPVFINPFPGTANTQQRINGFVDGFGNAPAPIVIVVPNGASNPTAEINALKGTMSSHPGVDGVMLPDTSSAGAIVAAVSQGTLPQLKVGTFDYTSALLDAIAAGSMLFAVDQQQYMQGYYGVLIITLFKSLGFQPVRSTLTGPSFVTKDNVDLIRQTVKSGARSA